MKKFKRRNLSDGQDDKVIQTDKKRIYWCSEDDNSIVHKFDNGCLVNFKYKGNLYLVFDDKNIGWRPNGISRILKIATNTFSKMISSNGFMVEITLTREPQWPFPASRNYELVSQDYINSLAAKSRSREIQLLKEFTQNKVNKVIWLDYGEAP